MKSILQHIGLLIVDTEDCFSDISAMPAVFWEYVHKATRSGIIKSIENLTRLSPSSNEGKTQATSDVPVGIGRLNNEEREKLRLYLAACEPIHTISDDEWNSIRTFPIFTTFREKLLRI